MATARAHEELTSPGARTRGPWIALENRRSRGMLYRMHTYPFEETMGMPIHQVNAHLQPDLMMRIGIPHRGGKLAFHAFNQDYAAMVSANAFWDQGKREFKMPEATDLSELDFALDSAGFTAMKLWQSKGAQKGMAGVFPWSLEQYVEFASLSGASWWSQPDFCCEPEIAADQAEINHRMDATATLLEATLRVVWAWQEKLAATCNARTIAHMIRPPVPVLQGWCAKDYLRSLDLLMQIWGRWEPWLASPTLIGIGSVCRRSLDHPTHGLYAILGALEGRLPAGARVHLFGVKGTCLEQVKSLDWVASADSMAYDFGARMQARQARISNSLAHRQSHMTAWMTRAAAQLRASQSRLAF